MAEPAIRTEHLTVAYGKQTLGVIELDLEVRQGEVFGFLGPNGAGKTTTLRVLMDLIRPTYGRAEVLGRDCQEESLAVRQTVGYLPGEGAFWPGMDGQGLLDHIAKLRGGVDEDVRDELVERLDVELERPIDALSTGNKRKLGLVAAFMGEPEVLILDEPTSGLDPLMQEVFHELVQEATAAGRTVLLSSHVLTEVERVCDRVGILRDGRLVHVAPMSEVKQTARRKVRLQLAEPVFRGTLSRVPCVVDVEPLDDGYVALTIEGSMDPLIKLLAEHEVLDMVSHEPDLEEVFLEHYRGPAHGR